MSNLAVANLGIENYGVESSSRASPAGLIAAARDASGQGTFGRHIAHTGIG
jgi:hypothetical protein